MLYKNFDRIHYLKLILTLNTGYLITNLLWFYYSIIPVRKKREIDIIFFPYAQPGSDGYKRRFESYLPYFNKENIRFIICDIIDDKKLLENLEGTKRQRYRIFRQIYWKRLQQVLLAKKCKAAFIQRGLFVAFPDQHFPYLERLLSKLNSNITIDFWDSFWVNNNLLVDKAASYCHKISCVNNFVVSHFSSLHQPKLLFPIGVDLSNYLQKKDYTIKGTVKFFYTGLPFNVEHFISIMSPVFEELIKKTDFKLMLVTRHRMSNLKFPVEYHYFDESTFYNLLLSADIGLYAIDDSEISQGKMASKVLDYMATGLPSVASPYGLTSYAKHNENILIASDKDEFLDSINKLVSDLHLREKIGKSAYQTILNSHEISQSYTTYKKIIQESAD